MDNAVVRVRMSVIRLALTHDRPNKIMVRRPDRYRQYRESCSYLTSTIASPYDGRVRVSSPAFRLRSAAGGISAACLSR
jgi:hypothetical protein